ncbi:hypothetical protein NE237_004780 [Protea cynaroides]|uniref:TIR domain-containing protein n=1 Tax=Protea cynaroides TaxID=273540 RepID=A0A9Q0KJK4_9MAGN|nr:hypothetical protein NE237_004780 [Protea cynaroides]
MYGWLILVGIIIILCIWVLFHKRIATTANGMSDSASSSPKDCDYEVFLSFRGVDTRTNFTDHLYNALRCRGIRTFRDKEEFEIGKKMDPKLWSAIHQSKIAIPIFSKNYASSEWCLRELAEIVKCMNQRQITVMPVFYHVDPYDVRDQTGSYMEPIRNHQKKFGKEIEEWKNALKVVGELNGWEPKKIADGYEGELIKLIIKEVWSVLRKSPLIVPDNLVGCDSHVEKMMKLLKIESDDINIVVGIHGLSGIGKTTIARCVFNEVYHKFDACSFIANAQEILQKEGPVYLQSQLIGNFLTLDNPNIASVDHGIQMMRERLSNKRVFLVFDDVNFDLNQIIGDHDWLSFGSRIIITTKDKHILKVFGANEYYEPNGMDSVQALQLFSKHAFKRDQPLEHFLDLSKEVVKTTGGLPLALEIMGSFLFGVEDSKIWEDTVKELKIIPNEKVLEKLKISYYGLNPREQKIFLDIACFFSGMDKNILCYIWDGLELFPEKGIEVLYRKSLIKKGENNELRMHDLLRAVGREIVNQEKPEEPGKRSRLWSEKAILKVLNTHTGTRKVEGLSITRSTRQPLKSEGFAAMTNIRLLKLDYVVVSENFMHSFPDLRWLSWKGFRNIEFTLTNSRNLTVLDLSHGFITEKWLSWSSIKEAENLKFLDLSYSAQLSQTPNFSANLQLEVLLFQGCENLATIDASICELRSLKTLDIRNTKISQLPENLSPLEALMELLIDKTSIERLPNSIGQLKNLNTLSAQYCKIQETGIPDDIGRLSSLKYLNLNGNHFLSLPATVSSLSLLQTLSLMSCDKLQSLPQLSNLTNLKALYIFFCMNLVELPNTMNALTRLESLNLQGCDALQYISHLPSSLKSLEVACKNVREISAFLDMRNLETLCLHDCPKLAKIENLMGLDTLRLFKISDCPLLTELPNLGGLKKLKHLEFSNVGLAEIKGLEKLESLEELHLLSIPIRKKINLSKLKKLNVSIDRCNYIKRAEGLSSSLIKVPGRRTTSVWSAGVSAPKREQKLGSPPTRNRHKSERLNVRPFFNLKLPNLSRRNQIMLPATNWSPWKYYMEVPSVDRLESLEVLKIFKCKSMKILSDLSNITKLRELRIEHCEGLNKIQGSDRLEILEVLIINGCISIETLPCLSKLKKLMILSAVKCQKLTEIQGVEELQSLTLLKIDECISIETLPCLSKLKKLTTLSAVNCRKLTGIQGAEELESLKLLNISKCISIETLCLAKLKKLKTVLAVKCMNLTEIQGLDGLKKSLKLLDVRGCLLLLITSPFEVLHSAENCWFIALLRRQSTSTLNLSLALLHHQIEERNRFWFCLFNCGTNNAGDLYWKIMAYSTDGLVRKLTPLPIKDSFSESRSLAAVLLPFCYFFLVIISRRSSHKDGGISRIGMVEMACTSIIALSHSSRLGGNTWLWDKKTLEIPMKGPCV